jgi:lipoyl(octanoyl) transferase
MDMGPWSRINPCGLGIPMTQMIDFLEERVPLIDIFKCISSILAQSLGYNEHKVEFTLDY